MRRAVAGARATVLGSALSAAAACTPTPSASPDSAPTPEGLDTGGGAAAERPLTLSGVRYTLAWERGAAQVDSAGVALRTAAGVEVRITEGYVISATATLVPCAELEAGRTAPPGHGTFDDPSSSVWALAEALHAPATATLAEAVMEPTAYCRAHYMLSPDLVGDGRMPEGVDDRGWSLRLTGSYIDPNGATVPFVVRTEAAWGELWTLADLAGAAPSAAAGQAVELRITRRIDTLFDDVDLGALAADQGETLGAALLGRLIADTEATLHPVAL